MSKFNQTNTMKTTNKCGHVAYNMKDVDKLVTQVLTTFFGEQKFYGDNSNELVKNAEKIAKTKLPDLNTTSLESAMSMVKGTARSMGVTVVE